MCTVGVKLIFSNLAPWRLSSQLKNCGPLVLSKFYTHNMHRSKTYIKTKQNQACWLSYHNSLPWHFQTCNKCHLLQFTDWPFLCIIYIDLIIFTWLQCLLFTALPFLEDLRQFMFAPLDENKKLNPSSKSEYFIITK